MEHRVETKIVAFLFSQKLFAKICVFAKVFAKNFVFAKVFAKFSIQNADPDPGAN
jgi:hypothetical protein